MPLKTKNKKNKNKTNIDKLDTKKLDRIAGILCPSQDDYADELNLLTQKRYK